MGGARENASAADLNSNPMGQKVSHRLSWRGMATYMEKFVGNPTNPLNRADQAT
jgi:hypothetical protein